MYMIGWLVVLRIFVAVAIFQPYRYLEAGDNQFLKLYWQHRVSNPRTSSSACQELHHYTTAAPHT